MIRHLPAIVLTFMAAPSWAGIYKCEVDGKKAEYRSTPCPAGKSVQLKVAGAPAPTTSTPKSQAEASPGATPSRLDDRLTLNLPSVPVRMALQIVADFVGYTLVADPSVTGDGSFSYQNQPAGVVLADIAKRHGLAVATGARTITVKRK